MYRINIRLLSLVQVLFFVFGIISCSGSREGKLGSAWPAVEFFQGEGSNWTSDNDGSWLLSNGSTGLIKAPAWWPDNRPPRGEMVVLELEYRDNMQTPARVEVFSGLARADRLSGSELHRIGGMNDGAWKKARVPCPWDFLYAYGGDKGEREAVFFLRSGQGSISVRSARLTGPQIGDEENWNAQTREWVAYSQRGAKADPAYWDMAEDAVLEGPLAEEPLVAYQRS